MDELLQLLMTDPAFAEQLSQIGVFGDRADLNARQYGQAHELFNTPTPKGMEAGGTYVAASPVAHLAAALRQYQGKQGMAQQDAALGGMIDQQQGARGALARAFARPRPPIPAVPVEN